MDKTEIRQILRKKPKPDLIKLIQVFSRRCTDFKFSFDTNNLSQSLLASKLGSVLINLLTKHPENEPVCNTILEGDILDDFNLEQEDYNKHIPEIFTSIPFEPKKICTYFTETLLSDTNFLEKWTSNRHLFGFRELISLNDLVLPKDIERELYNRIIQKSKSSDMNIEFKYSRYHLEEWESEFKKLFERFSKDEIDIILSFNFIYQELKEILDRQKKRISYYYDDIPLLKRVISSQYIKLIKKKSCDDDGMDELADIINEIVEENNFKSSLVLFPWSEFE